MPWAVVHQQLHLINNAGVLYPNQRLQDLNVEQILHTFAVNTIAPILLNGMAAEAIPPKKAIPALVDLIDGVQSAQNGTCFLSDGSVFPW